MHTRIGHHAWSHVVILIINVFKTFVTEFYIELGVVSMDREATLGSNVNNVGGVYNKEE